MASRATSEPIKRSPKQITFASLCWRASFAVRLLLTTAARTTGFLLAAIEIPMPDPHTRTPNSAEFGVLVCGSGIGISIAANRNPVVRAAVVSNSLTAKLARQHNDANVICFGERLIGSEVARDAMQAFLETDFEGGRHARRVDMLAEPKK